MFESFVNLCVIGFALRIVKVFVVVEHGRRIIVRGRRIRLVDLKGLWFIRARFCISACLSLSLRFFGVLFILLGDLGVHRPL